MASKFTAKVAVPRRMRKGNIIAVALGCACVLSGCDEHDTHTTLATTTTPPLEVIGAYIQVKNDSACGDSETLRTQFAEVGQCLKATDFNANESDDIYFMLTLSDLEDGPTKLMYQVYNHTCNPFDKFDQGINATDYNRTGQVLTEGWMHCEEDPSAQGTGCFQPLGSFWWNCSHGWNHPVPYHPSPTTPAPFEVIGAHVEVKNDFTCGASETLRTQFAEVGQCLKATDFNANESEDIYFMLTSVTEDGSTSLMYQMFNQTCDAFKHEDDSLIRYNQSGNVLTEGWMHCEEDPSAQGTSCFQPLGSLWFNCSYGTNQYHPAPAIIV